MARTKLHTDGMTPFYVSPTTGERLVDLIGEDGRPVQLIEKPAPVVKTPAPKKARQQQRVGRFYIAKDCDHYVIARVDGTGEKRVCDNKKEAIATALRITARLGEAERRTAAGR